MTFPPFLMAASLVLAMPVAIVQNRGLVPLAAILGVAALLTLRRNRAWQAALAPGAVLAALALGAWGALSSAWALDGALALLGGLRLIALTLVLALVLAAASAVQEREARMLRAALVAGTVLGAILILIELHFDAPLNNALRGFPTPPRSAGGTKPAATVLALFAGPAMFAAWQIAGRGLAACVGLLAGAAVLAATSESARLALVAAALAGGIAILAPSLSRRVLPGLLAAAALAGPPLLAEVSNSAARAGLLPSSAVHRMLIWDFAAERAAERTLIGFGMDAARGIPGGRANPDTAMLERLGVPSPMKEQFERFAPGAAALMPLHPHSMPLQVRLELGLVGLALFALFAFLAGRAVASLHAPGAFAAGTAMAVAATVVCLLSYGVWQHWWWVAVALAALSLLVAGARGARRAD
jgi:hypothetical protein